MEGGHFGEKHPVMFFSSSTQLVSDLISNLEVVLKAENRTTVLREQANVDRKKKAFAYNRLIINSVRMNVIYYMVRPTDVAHSWLFIKQSGSFDNQIEGYTKKSM